MIDKNYDSLQISLELKGSSTIEEEIENKIPSKWYNLPPDIVHRLLYFMFDIDMCGYLMMVSKKSPFKPTELYYRSLCEYVYGAQTMRGRLILENWKSWQRMLAYRPRLRTNGFYCLKTLFSRAPNNDSFWEPRRTQSVEVTYYRYLRFFNNGSLLYALNTVHPYDMEKQLKLGVPEDRKIFFGYYKLSGRKVEVEVK